jgi:hypothetical protein
MYARTQPLLLCAQNHTGTLVSKSNFISSAREGEGDLSRHLYEHHLKSAVNQLPAAQPFICPCCWYEAASRLSLLTHVAAAHAHFFTQPRCAASSTVRPVQLLADDQQAPGLTMIQVALHKTIHPERAVPASKPAVIDKTLGTENPFKTLIEGMLGDVETDEEAEVDHSMTAYVGRWLEMTGSGTAAPEVAKEEESGEPAGLRTLAPRHALTMQESARLNLRAEGGAPPPATVEGAMTSLAATAPSHSWLCDGRLLHLTDAASPANLALFQYQWARGQPVLISNSNRYLDRRLWHPRAFLKDFGHLRSDLINTLTGKDNEG